jgi:tRNA threonylcarbamoyladenosine biosynthesis protein TsaE
MTNHTPVNFADYCTVKSLEISIVSLEELPALAKSILQFGADRKVFAFYAQMGAGKTTLIKEICKQLGSTDNFSSPTYSVVNEYQITTHKIFHIDCYRLKNLEEALSIGMEEYLSGDDFCFIEWPEMVEPLLPDDVIKISIRTDNNVRNVSIFTK